MSEKKVYYSYFEQKKDLSIECFCYGCDMEMALNTNRWDIDNEFEFECEGCGHGVKVTIGRLK